MTSTTSGTRRQQPRTTLAAPPEPTAEPPRGWLMALARTARSSVPELVLLVLLMLVTYWQVVTTRYAFLDDYSVLYRAQRTPDDLLAELVGAGRPITGALDYVLFAAVPDVDGLLYLRILGLLGMTAFVVLTLLVLRTAQVPRAVAAGAALAVGILPSSGIVTSWTTTYHVPLALLLGASAGLLVSPVPGQARRFRPRRVVAAAVLLLAALCDYQPAAMVFWGFVVALFVLPATSPGGWRKAVPAVVPSAVAFAGASALGFVVLQIGIRVSDVTSERASFVSDIPGKLDWYVSSFVPRAFAPMVPVTHDRVAVTSAIAVAVGLALLGRRNGLGWLLTPVLGGVAILAASVPNLLTAENWASSRSSTGVMIVAVLLATCAATGLLNLVARDEIAAVAANAAGQTAVVMIALVGAVTMRDIVNSYMVDPQVKELALARQVVAEAASSTKPVTLVPASWADTPAPGISYDEFGTPSTCAAWVPEGLFQLLYRERTGRWYDAPVNIAENPADGSTLPAPPGQVVIDFGHMLQPAQGDAVYSASEPAPAGS